MESVVNRRDFPRKRIALMWVAGALQLPSLASAGGLMTWEIGTPTLGTASAGWAAMPEDASTAYTNPAGTVWRDDVEIRAAGQMLYGDIDSATAA